MKTFRAWERRPRDALGYAQRFAEVKIDVDAAFTYLPGERIVGVALHLMGKQHAARAGVEGMLAKYVPRAIDYDTPGFQLDQGAMARVTLARVYRSWATGNRRRECWRRCCKTCAGSTTRSPSATASGTAASAG